MGAWRRALISWVNVLRLLPNYVGGFKEIFGTQFFDNFLREVCGEADCEGTPQHQAIVQFIKREYPKFDIDERALELSNEVELEAVLSLFLFHSVTKGAEAGRAAMCKDFDVDTQVLVKTFVEVLLPMADALTKHKVSEAIHKAETSSLKTDGSPLCFSSTPTSRSRRTLQTFLQSPASLQQKVVNEKCQEIRKLKLLLESERCEKNHLVDELARADEKFKNMSEEYERQLKEVRKLKSEGTQEEAEGRGDSLRCGHDNVREQNYTAVVGNLKHRIDKLEEGTYMLNQQNEVLKKQVKSQNERISALKSEVEEYSRECEKLGEELETKNGQVDTLLDRCRDLEKFVEETKTSGSDPCVDLSSQSFTGETEDLGRVVTDLKLCEEVDKNRALAEELERMEVDLREVRARNSALMEKLKVSDGERELLSEELRQERQRFEDLQYEKHMVDAGHAEMIQELAQKKDRELKFLEQQCGDSLRNEKQVEAENLTFYLQDVCQLVRRCVLPLVEGDALPGGPSGPEDTARYVSDLMVQLQERFKVEHVEAEKLTFYLHEVCQVVRRCVLPLVEGDALPGGPSGPEDTARYVSDLMVQLQERFKVEHVEAEKLTFYLHEVCHVVRRCVLTLVEGEALPREPSGPEDTVRYVSSLMVQLRERFKVEYTDLKKQLDAREEQLSKAKDAFRSMREKFEAELLRKVQVVGEEYNGKLDALKATMKEAYNSEVSKVKASGESERAFTEELKGKYRQLALEKRQLQEELLRVKTRPHFDDVVRDAEELKGKCSQLALEKRQLQEELLRFKARAHFDDVVRDADVVDETFTCVTRRRRRSVRTSGMGRMFHEEDEQGEEFNNTYLADLKAGVCATDRLDELRYRNSLCPQHLKSSYPAETQFYDPGTTKDEDIMMGLPAPPPPPTTEDQARRKDRGYKKPGPPTPGKNRRPGDWRSPPRRPLRETNDGSERATPSRVKALFGLGRASRRDENAPTPRTKAMGLFRIPRKKL